jgi:protein-S-isoprenylcysteine O-methyltransferase Ste14
MDGFRYVVAVLVAVSVPPAILYWFGIHPFAGFWRRLGPKRAYTVLALGFAVVVWLCWRLRDPLLGRDLGTRGWLIAPGVLLYLVAAYLSREVQRHLSLRILLGVPEIVAGSGPGKLLREGIYGRVRHPRYTSFLIGSAGSALIVNYLGIYVMTAALFPALHVIAIIEERELRQRFGADYAAYAAAVPRLIPRFGRER